MLHIVLLLLAALAPSSTTAGSRTLALTEETFEDRLRTHPSALVAFMSPWCMACRNLASELDRTHSMLAQRQAQVLVAKCDASRETRLAARYGVRHAPVILFFPDTRVLAPRLQVIFVGQMLHTNLASFVHGVWNWMPKRVRTVADVRQGLLDGASRAAGDSSRAGAFVGFFRTADGTSVLQDMWSLDCAKRHTRMFALANGLQPGEDAEELWQWANLAFERDGPGSEEAIVFVAAEQMSTRSPEMRIVPRARFMLQGQTGTWQAQAESFCAWCERQVLDPVTVFDAARAAALDGSFEWLLLLFAPLGLKSDDSQQLGHQERQGVRSTTRVMDGWAAASSGAAAQGAGEDSESATLQLLFPRERQLLKAFLESSRAGDKRYHDMLVVLVPWGDGELAVFRDFFGAEAHRPSLASTSWATVVFNTRTRRQYRMDEAGWQPEDDLPLRRFTDAVLDGKLLAHIRSAAPPPDYLPEARSKWPHVEELTGFTFADAVVVPVLAGHTEVLLLLYASWCSHSIAFQPLWRELVLSLASAQRNASQDEDIAEAEEDAASGTLLVAQMDGSQNEHPALPHVSRFPTVVLCVKSGAAHIDLDPLFRLAPEQRCRKDAVNDNVSCGDPGSIGTLDNLSGAGLQFIQYSGDASLNSLHSWLRDHAHFMPPLPVSLLPVDNQLKQDV